MSWTQPGYEAVACLVSARTGLTFTNRQDSAEHGIQRARTRAGVPDLIRYRDLLAGNEELLNDLIGELTVGETYFFREPAQFQCLRRLVLPEIRQHHGGAHVPRLWSAACASGEEAYSLAIVLEEEGLGGQAQLLATDLSPTALAKARRAVYGEWSLRGESAAAALPYLQPSGKLYRVSDAIRRRVTIKSLNLALDGYPSLETGVWGMDVILCRNVLIYFGPEAIRAVARRLFDSLADGGWLLTASSDPPLEAYAPFAAVVTEAGVFYRRGATVAFPSQQRPAESLTPAAVPLDSFLDADAKAEEIPAPQEDIQGLLSPETMVLAAPVVETVPPSASPALAEARQAFTQGDYERVVRLAQDMPEDASAAALHVRALANLDIAAAEGVCAAAVSRHRFGTELCYLHAVLLLHLGRHKEAARSLRRVLYLDRSLAVAHFTLGAILQCLGDQAGARRAFRNAQRLCAARPADEVVPLTDGDTCGHLARAAGTQLALLDSPAR